MTAAPPPPEPQRLAEGPIAGPRTAPLELWLLADNFLNTFYALFGAPLDVMRSIMVSLPTYRMMRSWLRAGEVLMRRLLLLEAIAHEVEPHTRKRSPRQRKGVLERYTFTPNNPEAWRVSFRCLVETQRCRAYKRRGRRCVIDSYFARPLAERFEALLRVFNDPAPFARRLARRMRKDPRCVDLILREPNAPPDVGRENAARLRQACLDALKSASQRIAPDTT